MKSFNELNNIFENHISQLYSTEEGRKVITKYLKLIKENEILKEQYKLFNQLKEGVSENFKAKTNLVEEYVSYIPTLFEKYTKKQIAESNEKLYQFLKEYTPDFHANYRADRDKIMGFQGPVKDTTPVGKLDYFDWADEMGYDIANNDYHKLYNEYLNESKILKAAEYLIYEGKTNLEEYINQKNVLIEELKTKNKNVQEEKRTLDEMLSDFNEKYEGKLTNEEISIIKELILSTDKNKKKEALKEYQKDCLKDLNVVLQECSDTDIKERLLSLKEQVLFDRDNSLNENIIKLNEIKNVLKEFKLDKDEEDMSNE